MRVGRWGRRGAPSKRGSVVDRRALPALALGAVALLALGVIVVTSATGAATTPGVIDGGPRLIADSFRAPGVLNPSGAFQWATEQGSWSLSGTALVADEASAQLVSQRELPRGYRLGVIWEEEAEGGRVDLHWDEGETWVFRLTAEGFEFVHAVDGRESVVASGALPEKSLAGPSVLLTRTPRSVSVDLTGANLEDRRRVASVDHLEAPTTTGFSIGSERAGVRFARIELELPS
ncbi:MAG: hypothetical protein WAX12_17225 [Candidatus Microthrix subdominans]